MRIATWNVNSLKARMEAVEKWLARAEPDVLLIQETKLADADAPVMPFSMLGYELVHHGEGRWNGVGILTRVGAEDVITNFGDGPVRDSSPGSTVSEEEDDFDPFDEARMVSAVCGGVRVVSLYAPNGRVVGSPFYEGKLRWFERRPALARRDPVRRRAAPARRRLQRHARRPRTSGARPGPTAAPTSRRRSGPRWPPCAIGASPTPTGPSARSAAGSRGGTTGPACSTATRACGSTSCTPRQPVAERVVWAEIDREARKGPPTPSDHAPVVIDLDEPGSRSTPAGRARWSGSRRGRNRARDVARHRTPAGTNPGVRAKVPSR